VDDLGLMDTSVPFLTDSEGIPVKHPLNEFYRTPSLENLADRGIRFEQFDAMNQALANAGAQFPVTKTAPPIELRPEAP